MTIPRILHFTWKTEDVPGVMGDYLGRWRDLHPDWDIRLWTDATMREFVAGTYPDFLGPYDAYPRPIQRADCFRYLVINALGGVYADLDVEPFRAIDDLVVGLECFAGIEPDEHMGSDRWHSGAPFLVTNAFIGGVAGHPWFRQLVALLPQTAGVPDIFLSTGPSLTTGAALRMKREDRPVLILPKQWSPTIDGGRPCRSDRKLSDMLGGAFDLVDAEGEYVAHRWLSSWVSWDKRHKWLARPFHAMNTAKWALRRRRHRDLAQVEIKDSLYPYLDQTPKPPETWPKVAICVVAETKPDIAVALVDTLARLDYPTERLSFVLSLFDPGTSEPARSTTRDEAEPSTWQGLPTELLHRPPQREVDGIGLSDAHWRQLRWSRLANGAVAEMRGSADFVLFVDAGVTGIPQGALKAMLSADKPVVALAAQGDGGQQADLSVFRYRWGGGIRVVYKIRGEDGLADPQKGQRDYLCDLRAFAQVPLDGVGQSFVLIRRDVLDKGVRFAEMPYHLHLGGEGLALMARHMGFEAAGLTEWAVTK